MPLLRLLLVLLLGLIPLLAGAQDVHPLLGRERATNQALEEALLRAGEQLATLNQRNAAARQEQDNLDRIGAVIDEQISVLQGSVHLSRILVEQKRMLTQPGTHAQLTEEIADIRLQQFEVNKQHGQLGRAGTAADRVLAELPPGELEQGLRDALVGVMAARASLLERLGRELAALLAAATTLQASEALLQTTAARLRKTLDEQMFWIPSSPALDLAWLGALPQALQAQLGAIPWQAIGTELWDGLMTRPFLFLPVLLLTLALLVRRRWLQARLASLRDDLDKVRRDSQLHTPSAVLINLLLALPVSLLLGLGGLALQLDARGQNASLGAALLKMAEAWLVFYTAYRCLEPGGVAERHFHWRAALAQALYRRMRSLGLVVLALSGLVAITERQPELLATDALGTLTLVAGCAVMAWLLRGLLLDTTDGTHPSPLRALFRVVLVLMPVGLIVVVATGYHYSALKLTGRLIDSLFLLIVWRLLEAMAVRALTVAARRLNYQRMLARRQAPGADGKLGADGEVLADNPARDLEQINQQSLRLLRLGLLGALLAGLYWVWADLITVFAYLENVTLYEYTSRAGEAVSLVPISLRDVLGALVIALITFILAANLPGLLEVLVLARMKLAQGSAYAITTLLSYVIVSVGIVATLSTLGVSWDKLQWLVAALSVGLGFGLQEIFANFVSGLIILFERPARIGDTVTIGNLSGTVSRIQIRATTITDFDRKEIIVPNKAFITGQLTNWSLTDTVTRVTIKVGVAYGSDLELVRKLLLQAAEANPRVLRDPAPTVFFLAFGASDLEHELRVHVREIGDRMPATDELNRCVDQLFRQHGIKIAFNQLDIHLRGGESSSITTSRITSPSITTPPPAEPGA